MNYSELDQLRQKDIIATAYLNSLLMKELSFVKVEHIMKRVQKDIKQLGIDEMQFWIEQIDKVRNNDNLHIHIMEFRPTESSDGSEQLSLPNPSFKFWRR